MSKLVDPASTLFAKGATMLFSSLFRKQLVPLPPAEPPVASFEPRKVVPDISDTNCLPEMQEQGSKCEDDSRGHSNDGSISELEQLVKQKNFTRDEYDRLTELLRSRTLDLPEEDASKRIEQNNLLPTSDFKKLEDEDFPPHEDRIESSKFVGIISTPSPTSKIPEEVLASPAEVAKAFMGLRPSQVSASSFTLRSQMLREATASPSFIGFAPKSATSKSVIRFSGVPQTFENGYTPPRSQGRSAIYKMSRSTCFKGQPMVNHKEAEPIGGGYPGPSTSTQWTPVNFTLRSGKQVLKRRSSVLESDLGSLGTIRRIRQKSSLVSSSEGIMSEAPGNFLPTENALVTFQRSFSIQKPSPLHEQKRDTPNMKNVEIQEERNGYASVPLQSREMAKKILQQLDKLVPSPKTESTEAKTISGDESLPKLRLDMLHEPTLKSVAEINASKLLNMGTNSKLEGSHNFHATSLRSAIFPMKGKAENGTDMASQANRVATVVTSVVETGPVNGSLDSVFAHSAAGPLQKKPAFKMQAPEDSLEQEADMYSSRDVSCPSGSVKEKVELDDFKVVNSEIQVTKKPFTFSSQCMSTSDITFNKVVGKGVSDGPVVADKDTGFAFQVSLPPSIECQAPVKPTVQSRAIEGLLTSSEQNAVPLFSFGSKSNPLTFPSSVMSTTDSTSLKLAARSNLEGKSIGSSTATAVTTAPVEYTELEKAEETQKTGDMLKLAGTSSSLIFSMSTTSNSFQSATPRQSNGSLTSDSSIFSVSSASAASLSGNLSSSTVFASPAPVSSSSNEPSSSPTFSALPSFQFGAGSSATSPDSSSAVVKSTSKDLGPKLLKELPSGIASSALAAVSTFSSAGTSVFGFSASASSDSGSIFGTQAVQSGSGASCFAQTTTSQFGYAASAFGLASSFGFSSSAFGSSASNVKSFGVSSGSGPSSSLSCPAAGSVIPGSSPSARTVAAPSVFGSSSHSPVFGSAFGPSLSSTLPTFGTSSATSVTTFRSSVMPPFSVSSSSSTTSSVFSFTQATATSTSFTFTSGPTVSSAPLSPVVPSPPGNDQMNVEDIMADDTSHAATTPVVPAFGQPSGVPTPSLTLGSPPTLSGAPVFQFAALQPSAFPQSETPFQATGSFEFGGNFSMGSGGGDNSGRRIIRVKRDKHRKK